MSEVIKYASGVEPQALMAKLQYSNGITQNMFSPCERLKEKKTLLGPTLLKGVTIPKLWESVFANKSDFLKRYHDRRKETDMEVGKWEYSSDMSSGYRAVSLTTTIDVPKAGTLTQLNEAHRFAYTCAANGSVQLMYQISSQTPGVPAGQSFRTEAFLAFTADSVDGDCTVCVRGGCKKLSMAFSAIQYIALPRALREMTQGYRVMLEMIAEDLADNKLSVTTGDDGAAGGIQAEDNTTFNGGGSDDVAITQGPSILFQGLLLVFAAIVTLSLLWSISTLRGTARVASVMRDRLYDEQALSAQQRSSLSGSLNMEQSTGVGTSRTPLTQDQALRHAARDAQIQSLRYRWMEQRVTIGNLESTVHRLWWMSLVQLLFVFLLTVKVFFY
ncbi:VASt domain [Trypanosoma melophagium]|uniref:VASt domain n=1 Tax=Trypanosoma melophagium TaxID=715481 RepID=UPI00351AA780|nr:VASt domain [Trypanosoma melophagium]